MAEQRHEQQQPQNEYQRVKALMKELDSPSGFDPIPPDQHRWMMDPNQPPLQRMWAWMLGHTIHWGHRSAFAVDKSSRRELHIEHAAKDLGMDLSNAHRVWKTGEARGLWRKGSEDEGGRRLYLTGKVPKFKGEQEAKQKSVQTMLPAHIWKQVKQLPEDKQHDIREFLEAEDRLDDAVQAALIAGKRMVFTERQNSKLLDYGIDPISGRQVHQKQTESPEDVKARLARLEPILAPISKYVQTIADYVQSAPETSTNQKNEPQPYCVSESKNQRSIARSGPESARSRPARTPTHEGREAANLLPAPKPAPPLSAKEREAENLIYSEILRMQNQPAFQHLNFVHEKIDRHNKADQLFVFRILQLIGPDNTEAFLRRVWAKMGKFDVNALGKSPARDSSAPRSLGIIHKWAIEYSKQIAEAAQCDQEQQDRYRQRQLQMAHDILSDSREPEWIREEARKIIDQFAYDKAQAS